MNKSVNSIKVLHVGPNLKTEEKDKGRRKEKEKEKRISRNTNMVQVLLYLLPRTMISARVKAA